ncbi:conserved hypothetical protein [Rhizobium sp. EC-SD404]|nr:conserved hypothetical protein [Rhizobium sp. EC-SD404]
MIGLFDGIKIGLGGLISALLMFGASALILQPQAYERGREAERAAALERSMDLIRERNATDEEIGRLSDAELCSALGGLWVPERSICE